MPRHPREIAAEIRELNRVCSVSRLERNHSEYQCDECDLIEAQNEVIELRAALVEQVRRGRFKIIRTKNNQFIEYTPGVFAHRYDWDGSDDDLIRVIRVATKDWGWMMECCRCFLPIHLDDAVDYLGDRAAHRHARCVELLRAKLAVSEAKCAELMAQIDADNKRNLHIACDNIRLIHDLATERAARAEAERLAVCAVLSEAALGDPVSNARVMSYWHGDDVRHLNCDGTPAGILAALRQAEETTR